MRKIETSGGLGRRPSNSREEGAGEDESVLCDVIGSIGPMSVIFVYYNSLRGVALFAYCDVLAVVSARRKKQLRQPTAERRTNTWGA